MAENFKVGLVIKAFDQVTGPLKKINDRLTQFQAPLRRMNNAFRGFTEASGLRALSGSITQVGGNIANLGGAVFSLGQRFAIMGGLAAAGLGKIVHDTVETASQLSDLSDATGASMESIQRLGHAWTQSGGSLETYQKALQKFSVAVGQAKKGAGPLVNTLKKVDPKLLKNIVGQTDTGEGFKLFVQGLTKAKTDAGRLALSAGVVGTKLAAPLAIMAKGGWENFKELLETTPNVIGDKEGRRAEKFGDTLGDLKSAFGGLLATGVLPLIPVLDDFAKSMTTKIIAFAPKIKAWSTAFAQDLPRRLEILRQGVTKFWESLQPLRAAFAWILADSGRVKIALGALAVVMSSNVIVAAVKLSSSLVGLAFNFGRVGLSLATLLAPLAKFALIGTALAGIFFGMSAGLSLLTRFLAVAAWDQLTKSAGNLLQVLTKIWDVIKLLSGVTLLKGLFSGDVGGEYRRTFEDLKKPFDLEAPKQFSQVWGEALQSVKSDASNLRGALGMGPDTGAWKGLNFGQKTGAWNQIATGAPIAGAAAAPAPSLGAADFMTKVIRQETVQKAKIEVKFSDMPRGTRVTSDKDPKLSLDLDLGYAMEAP